MSGPNLGERVVEFRSFYEQTKQDDSLLNHMILLDITSILDEIRETRIFFKKPRKTARTPKSHPKHPKMSKKKLPSLNCFRTPNTPKVFKYTRAYFFQVHSNTIMDRIIWG